MIEYWVSIDRRQAIFIHDFRQEQKPRLLLGRATPLRGMSSPLSASTAFAEARQSDSRPPRESARKWRCKQLQQRA